MIQKRTHHLQQFCRIRQQEEHIQGRKRSAQGLLFERMMDHSTVLNMLHGKNPELGLSSFLHRDSLSLCRGNRLHEVKVSCNAGKDFIHIPTVQVQPHKYNQF